MAPTMGTAWFDGAKKLAFGFPPVLVWDSAAAVLRVVTVVETADEPDFQLRARAAVLGARCARPVRAFGLGVEAGAPRLGAVVRVSLGAEHCLVPAGEVIPTAHLIDQGRRARQGHQRSKEGVGRGAPPNLSAGGEVSVIGRLAVVVEASDLARVTAIGGEQPGLADGQCGGCQSQCYQAEEDRGAT